MTLSIQKFFLEVNYRVWYTPLIGLNIVWLGEFCLASMISLLRLIVFLTRNYGKP